MMDPSNGSPRRPGPGQALRSLALGWAVAIPVAAGAAEPASENVLEGLSAQAAAAGVQVAFLQELTDTAALPASLESLDPSAAVAVLRGDGFDRVEIYGADGALERLVLTPRIRAAASLSTAVGPSGSSAPSSPSAPSARETDEREPTLAEAIATARDREASLSERQRAIALLAGSGSTEAVNVLYEVAGEEGGALTRAATLALSGFAGSHAESDARNALDALEANDIGDAADRGPAKAALCPECLVEDFRGLQNPADIVRLVYDARKMTSSAELTGLYAEALTHWSTTVKNVAMLEATTQAARIDAGALIPLLDAIARNDPNATLRREARLAKQRLQAGGLQVPPPAAELRPRSRRRGT